MAHKDPTKDSLPARQSRDNIPFHTRKYLNDKGLNDYDYRDYRVNTADPQYEVLSAPPSSHPQSKMVSRSRETDEVGTWRQP